MLKGCCTRGMNDELFVAFVLCKKVLEPLLKQTISMVS